MKNHVNKATKKAGAEGGGKPLAADRALTGRDFDRLTEAGKEAVYQQAEAITPDGGGPLTADQRKRWARVKRKMGRPAWRQHQGRRD